MRFKKVLGILRTKIRLLLMIGVLLAAAAGCQFAGEYLHSHYIREEASETSGNISEKKTVVIDICYGCGFSDYRYMNNAFKKYTGQTPNEFKKNMNSDSLPHNKKGTVKSYTPQEMLDTVTRFMENNHFNEHQI